VSLLKMNRRRLSFRTAGDAARYDPDLRAVLWGEVNTGSEYDGKHIAAVYRLIRQVCASDRAAYELTEAVWENRWHALRERPNGRGLDGTATILSEEPWAFEPEPSYFEDEE
jgi:hypothetical protein